MGSIPPSGLGPPNYKSNALNARPFAPVSLDKEYPAKALQIAKLKRQQEILASAFKVSAVHMYLPARLFTVPCFSEHSWKIVRIGIDSNLGMSIKCT